MSTTMTKAEVLKVFFSTPNKPVENKELLEFAKADKAGFDELAGLAAQELGVTLKQRAVA